jgi:hypothetical protein
MSLDPFDWLPIDDAARDGRPKLVRLGPRRASGRWNADDGRWEFPLSGAAARPLPFTPDEYAP